MTFNTHQAGGLLAAGLVLTTSVPEVTFPLYLLGAIAGSLGAALPDLDHAQSVPARSMHLAGYVTSKTLKHRGPLTHSIWTLLILGGFFYFYKETALKNLPEVVFLCFIAGIYSHHMLDKLTVQGLKWLWPVKITFWPIPKKLRINTNSWMERKIIQPSLWLSAAFVWLSPIISWIS